MRDKLDRLLARLPNLRPARLKGPDWELNLGELNFGEGDVERTLLRNESSGLLFGYFPPQSVLAELEEVGILQVLRQKGYEHFEALCGPPPGMPALSMFEDRFTLSAWARGEHYHLVELKTHWGELVGPPELGRIRALIWDWLSFENPLGQFTPERPPLPGQAHPGLGIFRQSTELLLRWVRKMELDAVVEIPEFFHNAVLYANVFHFVLPQLEGRFQALKRDLLEAGLGAASWALHQGRVLDQENQPVQWKPAEQVASLDGGLISEYFQSEAYRQAAQREKERLRFRYSA